LNVVRIVLPSLKERKEDIPLLVEHFVERFAKENKRKITGVDEEAMQRLINYDWPGNVRELENTIERAVVICKDQIIEPKHLILDAEGGRDSNRSKTIELPSEMTLQQLEQEMILKTLKEQGGNRTWTAKKLGISVRTLRNKLNAYRAKGIIFEEEAEKER
jgi:DNA-binding NtrC family response regulator